MKTTTGLKMTKNRRGCCSRLFLVLCRNTREAWNWSEPEVGFGIKQVTALYIEFYVWPQFSILRSNTNLTLVVTNKK